MKKKQIVSTIAQWVLAASISVTVTLYVVTSFMIDYAQTLIEASAKVQPYESAMTLLAQADPILNYIDALQTAQIHIYQVMLPTIILLAVVLIVRKK